MEGIEIVIDNLSDGVEILHKSLQCAICLELLKNPACTRCSHSFCWECIMRVMKRNRTAHCPLCNKSINRRSIVQNEKIGKLVEKVQNLIDGIGKDTGFDITSHSKLPTSTREAVLASPKFQQKKQETVSVQHEASPQKVSSPKVTTTSKEHWLKRYKKSYPGKRDSGEADVDLLSISQTEPLFPSFIARGKTMLAAKSKVDKLKVAPIEKVQEWLQRNDDEKPVQSPESQQQKSGIITVTADVHRDMDDETDLVSVSQQRFYVAPWKADVGTLQSSSDGLCTYDNVKHASDARRVFTSRDGNENNTKLGEKVSEGQSANGDPYKFISSQETRTVSKKKMEKKEKGKMAITKRESKNFKINGPSFKKDDKQDTAEKNKLSCKSPVSDFTFICPVEINDTFDNLVASTHKFEPEKTVKTATSKVHSQDDDSNDMCIFRTPLEVPIIYQKNDGYTKESISDIDFSSGSDDEWGAANQVNLQSIQVSGRRTRSSTYDTIPAKKSYTRSNFKQKTRSKSSGICSRRNAELEVPEDLEKKTLLSPAKKLNFSANIRGFNIDNMKQCPAICKDTNNKSEDDFVTHSSTDKTHCGKENIICPVSVKSGDEDRINLDQVMNMTVCSRSPGWSRISQSKKDFERFKKPVLKALNVSGGEVCIPKKHATFVSDMPKIPDTTNEVMSPVPTIDDSDSVLGIPMVAFNSPGPEALNRVKMSKIVMNLESQMGPRSSTGNIEVSTETKMPQTAKDVTLKKCTSFGSDAFSEPTNALDSPKSCQRKELISVIVSSLEHEDQLDQQCNEGNEQFMSHITKLGGDGAGEGGGEVCIPKKHVTFVSEMPKIPDTTNKVISPAPTIDDSDSIVGIPVVAFNSPSPEALNRVKMMSRIVMNLESQMGPRSSTGNTEVSTETKMPQTAKDVTLKKCTSFGSNAFSEPTNALDSPKSCQRKELFSVIVSSLEHEDQLDQQCNEGNEQFMSRITKLGGGGAGAQDCHNKNNDNIMKNPVIDMAEENVLMVQESNSSMDYEEATENVEKNPVIIQSFTPTREDCIQNNRPVEPISESGDNGSSNRLISVEAVQNGSISSEQSIILQGKGECNSAVPSLPVCSSQDLQDLILSKKCDQEKVAVAPSDVINSTKEVENSLPCSTKEPLADIQPKITSTEPMEIITKTFHQTEIHLSYDSSVGLECTYPNKIHIPFIKCGRLKSLRKSTKFVLLGSLAPRRTTMSSETFQGCSSADSLGLQFGVSGRPPLGMNSEVETQTSPTLLHSCHRSNIIDARVQTTPQINPQFFQFTTPTDTINCMQGNDNFVPDSCDNIYTFSHAIPIPHHSVLWQAPVDSNTNSKTEDSLISPVCRISELLHVDKKLVDSDMKDHSVKDDVDMNKTVVSRNRCGYSRPVGDYTDHEIPSSQFSTATTIKIQHIRTSDNEGQSLSKSPELSPNSAVHSGHSISTVQQLNNEKFVESIKDQFDTHASQKVISAIQYGNANNDERNAETHKQNKITESGKDSFAKHIIEDLNSKPRKCKQNDCGNTSVEKSRNRTSRASRQLKFSPKFTPKLSDPFLDISKEDGERDIQKLHKKSYKRIRMATDSLDSASTGSETNDVSDSETRKIKKPCHTSLKKASDEVKNNEVLLNQEAVNDEHAETPTEVIDLLTPPEEANLDLTPDIDDKTDIEEKWLGENVPNSEELMARVMANIEADLAETRKRKMKEGIDSDEERRKESPTLFTPSPVVADSEELASKMTCELVISQSEVHPEKRPVKESFLGNTTVGTDSESLCTQQRNKIQADIHNLESEIKECKAELQKVIENRSIDNVCPETVCGDSENESEDDFVEPTPRKEITSNKIWDGKPKDDVEAESKEVASFQQVHRANLTTPSSTVKNAGKRTVLHNPDSNYISPNRSPSVINSTEFQCKQTVTPKYQTTALNSDIKSHVTPTTSKQFVLRLPQTNTSLTSPIMRAENVTTSGAVSKSSVPANSSNTAKVSTPGDIPKDVLPQSSLQTLKVQMPASTELCFVCSGLHTGLTARVKALAKLLGAEFSNKFEPHTTHLVVKASDNMMADKTLKYLSAVVKKKWIVSIAWINACLQARKLVPEDEYEMLDSSGENGPHRSRTSSDLLYKNFEFCCIEPFTDLSREQLEWILKECGAVTVSHPEEFSFKAGHCCMIIVQMDTEREEECKEWWEHYGVLPVGHEWVLECIGRYRIIPIWTFLTCVVSEDHVRALGYPEDALVSDDDDDDTVVESQV